MNKIQRLFFLVFILLVVITAHAQTEQTARTWIGGDFAFTKSTAEDSGQIIAGARLDAAYDMRHGLQLRGYGEHRKRPAIKRLFTGDEPVEARSELAYGASLIYHVRREGRVRPMVGSGVSVIRHFFDFNAPPYPPGYEIYNSSVNPHIVFGASLGRRDEIAVTKYLKDTYSYSNLRGWGVDYVHTRQLSGPLHLRAGVRGKAWTFREGTHDYDKKAREFSGFVGFHFQ